MRDPSGRGSSHSRFTAGKPASVVDDLEEHEKTTRISVVGIADDGSAGRMTERAISVPAPRLPERATLTVIAGPTAGQVFAITEAETIIGRESDCQVAIGDSSVSRKHTRLTLRLDGHCVVEDLGSTNGTYINGEPVKRATIASGERIQIGPNVVVRFAMTDETEESMMRRLYESSTRDALTGAFNRRYFTDRLGAEMAYARRHGATLAVLILDVDFFKHVNDDHGHLMGDRVLRGISDKLGQTVRREDVFARLGGEEFAVLARSGNAIDSARLAERLRSAVEQLEIMAGDKPLKVTISVGVASIAECPAPGKDVELIALADQRLYRAKAGGRNRVCAG